MSLFFILRLHFVFQESAMKINAFILGTLVVLSIIGACLGCTSGVTGPFKLIHHNPAEDDGVNPNLVIAYSSLAITITVDVVVMVYYIQRLMSVVILQGEVSYVSTASNSNKTKVCNQAEMVRLSQVRDDSIDEEDEMIEIHVNVDEKIVQTITKSTLLSLIGILTSMWLNLEMLIEAIQETTDGVLFRAIASFDGAVNAICMYLVFSFAKTYYNIGCRLCHNGMSKCCLCVTKKAVVRDRTQEV